MIDRTSARHIASISRSPSVRRVAVGVVVVVFGLLLWAKLLLVTNHPRTAVADPEVSARAVSARQSAQAQVHAADDEGHEPR
ncbi:MAG: hypothetical protein KF745_04310 [Phycisphaeraceae bacterium]|nr:hypothetical protein [Phycisphaeraceae bacterium]